MTWVLDHLGDIWSLTLLHIQLSVPAIVLGFVISVPIGYFANRSPLAKSTVLAVGNILYTIPGVALVVLVPVALGLEILNPLNVAIALLIYAVAVMVRSASDAFESVPDDARQAAVSQGFSTGQRFWRIELPLAGPVLLAGIRVVSVSTISLATVGAFVGIPSLGTLFTDAYQRAFPLEAFVGIVSVLIVAAVFDVILTVIGRILLPWNRSTRVARRARLTTVRAG
jgi:osmoprotectant transport system permease protein